jgi:hypothetical protein
LSAYADRCGAPGSSAGPLTKEAALELVDEVMSSRYETARYWRAVADLRRVLDVWTGGLPASANP